MADTRDFAGCVKLTQIIKFIYLIPSNQHAFHIFFSRNIIYLGTNTNEANFCPVLICCTGFLFTSSGARKNGWVLCPHLHHKGYSGPHWRVSVHGQYQERQQQLCCMSCPDNKERIITEIISEEKQLLTYWEKAISLLYAYGTFTVCTYNVCSDSISDVFKVSRS